MGHFRHQMDQNQILQNVQCNMKYKLKCIFKFGLRFVNCLLVRHHELQKNNLRISLCHSSTQISLYLPPNGSPVGVGAFGLSPFREPAGEDFILNGSALNMGCVDSAPVGVLALGLGNAGRGGGFFFPSSGFLNVALSDANGSNPNGSFYSKRR